jgi:ribonuclease HII
LRASPDREPLPSSALVCGVDEAGRGALAGPVVAGAVVMPSGSAIPGIDDSKRLTPAARARLDREIRRQALAWTIGLSGPRAIDRINILRASLRAMASAVRRLAVRPGLVLVDGPHAPELDIPCRCIVGGDASNYHIACASILAKVHRDRLLARLDRRFPGYDLARHKGYPTAGHVRALRRLGPSPVHRLTFAPVRECR